MRYCGLILVAGRSRTRIHVRPPRHRPPPPPPPTHTRTHPAPEPHHIPSPARLIATLPPSMGSAARDVVALCAQRALCAGPRCRLPAAKHGRSSDATAHVHVNKAGATYRRPRRRSSTNPAAAEAARLCWHGPRGGDSSAAGDCSGGRASADPPRGRRRRAFEAAPRINSGLILLLALLLPSLWHFVPVACLTGKLPGSTASTRVAADLSGVVAHVLSPT